MSESVSDPIKEPPFGTAGGSLPASEAAADKPEGARGDFLLPLSAAERRIWLAHVDGDDASDEFWNMLADRLADLGPEPTDDGVGGGEQTWLGHPIITDGRIPADCIGILDGDEIAVYQLGQVTPLYRLAAEDFLAATQPTTPEGPTDKPCPECGGKGIIGFGGPAPHVETCEVCEGTGFLMVPRSDDPQQPEQIQCDNPGCEDGKIANFTPEAGEFYDPCPDCSAPSGVREGDGPYRIVSGSVVGPTIGGMHSGMWHNTAGNAGLEVITRELNAAYNAGLASRPVREDEGLAEPWVCDECDGSGVVGPASLSVVATDDHQVCPKCKGSGEYPGDRWNKCGRCGGAGEYIEHRCTDSGGRSNVKVKCSSCATPAPPATQNGETNGTD